VAVEKWAAGAGVGLTWTNAFTSSTLNSIVSGNSILSDLQIDNSAAFDMFADVEVVLASAAFTGEPYVGIYIYSLNSDNTTYGDGRYTSSQAGSPYGNYFVGTIGVVGATQAQQGVLRGIVIPPARFKFLFNNVTGITLASSGNTVKYRTYNRSVA
jgi:hypothetical protein